MGVEHVDSQLGPTPYISVLVYKLYYDLYTVTFDIVFI